MLVAQHYGLSPKEFDFVINYDAKFRASGDDEAEE